MTRYYKHDLPDVVKGDSLPVIEIVSDTDLTGWDVELAFSTDGFKTVKQTMKPAAGMEKVSEKRYRITPFVVNWTPGRYDYRLKFTSPNGYTTTSEGGAMQVVELTHHVRNARQEALFNIAIAAEHKVVIDAAVLNYGGTTKQEITAFDKKIVPGGTYATAPERDTIWLAMEDGSYTLPLAGGGTQTVTAVKWEGLFYDKANNSWVNKGDVRKEMDSKITAALRYFIDETGGTPATFSTQINKLTMSDGSVVNNNFNNTIHLNLNGESSIRYKGTPLFSSNPEDLDLAFFIVGKKNGNWQGVKNLYLLQPGQNTYKIDIIVDVEGFTELAINKPNAQNDPETPEIFLIKDEDSVKKYIDSKLVNNGNLFNVRSFGAKGDGVTDDRKAIQDAINACFLNGGGKVYFPMPDVCYNIGTGIASAADVPNGNIDFNANSQLVIPCNKDTTNLITIEMCGEYKPNMADEAIAPVGRSAKCYISSQRIATTEDGSSILSSAYGSFYGNHNYLHLHIENMIFRNKTVSGNVDIDNRQSGIDMRHITQFTFDYLKIETSSTLYNSVEPLSSFGLRMPHVSNKAQLGEGSVYICGFNKGIILGEHFTSKRLIVLGCVNGVVFPDTEYSYHSISLPHLNSECCRNIILMQNSNQVLNIFNYDVEHHNFENKWFNYAYDILKTGGTGRVNIFNATVTKSNVGNVNEFITSGNPDYKIFTGVGAN